MIPVLEPYHVKAIRRFYDQDPSHQSNVWIEEFWIDAGDHFGMSIITAKQLAHTCRTTRQDMLTAFWGSNRFWHCMAYYEKPKDFPLSEEHLSRITFLFMQVKCCFVLDGYYCDCIFMLLKKKGRWPVQSHPLTSRDHHAKIHLKMRSYLGVMLRVLEENDRITLDQLKILEFIRNDL